MPEMEITLYRPMGTDFLSKLSIADILDVENDLERKLHIPLGKARLNFQDGHIILTCRKTFSSGEDFIVYLDRLRREAHAEKVMGKPSFDIRFRQHDESHPWPQSAKDKSPAARWKECGRMTCDLLHYFPMRVN